MAEVIQPTEIPKVTLTNPKKMMSIKWLVILLLAVILVVAGWLAYNHYQNSGSYKSYNSYSLSGLGAGSGISLQKPSVFNQPATGENVKTQQGFYKYSGTSAQASTLESRLVVSETAFPVTADQAAAYNKAVTDAFAEPGANSADYLSFLSGINTVALNSYYKFGAGVSLNRPVPYTNAAIKSNAWSFVLTATDKTGKMPTQRGEVVYLIGKKARYYVVLSSTAANWQAHNAYWQQSLSSIKIDQ